MTETIRKHEYTPIFGVEQREEEHDIANDPGYEAFAVEQDAVFAEIDRAVAAGDLWSAEFVGMNHMFKEMGLSCPYEYCIETQRVEPCDLLRCPTFGHQCPAGHHQVAMCNEMNGEEV